MWWCIASFVLGLLVGRVIPRDSARIARLHKLGYYIRKSDHGAWFWVRPSFDKDLKPTWDEGRDLKNRVDAVANAEAHYYATITREQSP